MAAGDALRLTAYRLAPTGMRLVPSEARRPWMDAMPDGYANRCLPLLIANQNGWLLLNDATVRLRWGGGPERVALTVDYDGEVPHDPAVSHFGGGIVTWTLPYLFRTPPGWNLVVRGAPNNPRPGAAPLDAVVETDWSASPFTLNWQLLHPGEMIVAAGEPLCLLYPQRRGELEAFTAEIRDAADEPQVQHAVRQWAASRSSFLEDLPLEGTSARAQGWQREYFRGLRDGARQAEHQTRLHLSRFEETAER